LLSSVHYLASQIRVLCGYVCSLWIKFQAHWVYMWKSQSSGTTYPVWLPTLWSFKILCQPGIMHRDV
jgi:hypothetical protein